LQEKEEEKDFPVRLARKTLEEYLYKGKKIAPPANIPEKFKKKAGVFVSLRKKGRLRGCIGTFLPAKANIAYEIIDNAISAATRDPRFPPVEEEELKEIDISVDILSEPEPVNSLEGGLLLPDLEGVDTAEYQLEIAKQKAGLFDVPLEKLKIERFTVERYKEEK